MLASILSFLVQNMWDNFFDSTGFDQFWLVLTSSNTALGTLTQRAWHKACSSAGAAWHKLGTVMNSLPSHKGVSSWLSSHHCLMILRTSGLTSSMNSWGLYPLTPSIPSCFANPFNVLANSWAANRGDGLYFSSKLFYCRETRIDRLFHKTTSSLPAWCLHNNCQAIQSAAQSASSRELVSRSSTTAWSRLMFFAVIRAALAIAMYF